MTTSHIIVSSLLGVWIVSVLFVVCLCQVKGRADRVAQGWDEWDEVVVSHDVAGDCAVVMGRDSGGTLHYLDTIPRTPGGDAA